MGESEKDSPPPSLAGGGSGRAPGKFWTIWRTLSAAIALITIATAFGIAQQVIAKRRLDAEGRKQSDLLQARTEADRSRSDAEKAKAEAETARLKAEGEERERSVVKAAAQAEEAAKTNAKLADAEAAKAKADQKLRTEEERRNRVRQNTLIWPLWEEADHAQIRLLATREHDASVRYKDAYLSVKYVDMPEWLMTAALKRHRDDGESKGQIREVNGRTVDLRTNPAGWVALPVAEVIQIVEDGYMLIDERSLRDRFAQTKAFKLLHNGLARILNNGDRIQITAMSVGTYTYKTKGGETKTVPVYDPGMPIGPLREKVVTLGGKPATIAKKRTVPSDEPIGNGSGFFISEDGLFITNAHVVDDSVRIEVKTVAGRRTATVLKSDKGKDLALVKVSVVKGTVSMLSISTNSMMLGQQVFTIGFPLVEVQGSKPKYTGGTISSLAGIRDDPSRMQISVPVQPGNSGGPLANARGEIVGVIVSRLNDLKVMEMSGSVPQNVNYAIKSSTLMKFLDENSSLVPGIVIGVNPSKLSQDEAIQAVERASGLVLIY